MTLQTSMKTVIEKVYAQKATEHNKDVFEAIRDEINIYESAKHHAETQTDKDNFSRVIMGLKIALEQIYKHG